MKKKMKFLTICSAFVIAMSSVAYAHVGTPLDSNGGHKDRLGYYHYHHGYDAHLHINGVCPYVDRLTSVTEKDGTMPGTSVVAPLKEIPVGENSPKEISLQVLTERSSLKGPFLFYNNTYYLPIFQLAQQLPIVVSEDPVSNRIVVVPEKDEKKTSYINDRVVLVSPSGNIYHKFNCNTVQQQGLDNFFVFDERLVEDGTIGYYPCPNCIH